MTHAADPLTDPRRLPSIEQFALANRTSTPWLRRMGYMTDDGRTPAGDEALRLDADSRHEDALQRNVISGMKAAHMVILGKLIRDEALTGDEFREALSIELAPWINRARSGEIKVNSFGRQVYGLAAGRTY